MKHLITGFALAVSLLSFTAQAKWTCSGNCTVSCASGDQYRTMTGTGNSRAEAKQSAYRACYNQTSGDCTSAFPTVFDSDCRELAKQWRIIFKNNCKKFGVVHTAISYLGVDGQWKYEGFWSLDYGQTAAVAVTRNRNFYIHGHTNNFAQSWGSGSGPWRVRGELLNFGIEDVDQGANSGDYLFPFNCN